MKKCPVCHKENSDEASFCEECGQVLKPQINSLEAESDRHEKQLCSKCGFENDDSHVFCEKCGEKLSDTSVESLKTDQHDSSRSDKPPLTTSQTTRQVKSTNKRTMTIAISLVLFLIGIVGLYRIGKSHYSYENQVARLEQMLENKSSAEIRKNLISMDKDFEITEESIQPFIDAISKDDAYLSATINQLGFGDSWGSDIYLTQEGKHLFLFDKYVMVIKPIKFEVHTNLSGMTLAINQKEQGTANTDDYTWNIGPLSPGKYQFTGKFKDSDSQDSTIEESIDQLNQNELNDNGSRFVSLDVSKVKFNLTGQIENAEVFLDGKSLGQLKDNQLKNVAYIWHEGSTLTVKQTIGDLTLESENIPVDPNYYADTSDNATSDLNIPILPIEIYSNLKEGVIKVDDKKVATISDDNTATFNLVVPAKELPLQVVQSFDDGDLTSEKVSISPSNWSHYYDLSSDAGKDSYDFTTRLNDLYYKMTNDTDADYDFSDDEINQLAEFFDGGKDNKEFSDFKDAFIEETRKNPEISYIRVGLEEVESIKQVGTHEYELQYTVNYNTIYKSSTPSVDETFRYKKALFTDKDGEVKIKDLGGESNFEKVD